MIIVIVIGSIFGFQFSLEEITTFDFFTNISYMTVTIIYFTVLESKIGGGATPAKRVLSIQVVNEAGRKLSLYSSLIRNIVRLLWYIPIMGVFIIIIDIVLVYTTEQRIGDWIANTYVLKEKTIEDFDEYQSQSQEDIHSLTQEKKYKSLSKETPDLERKISPTNSSLGKERKNRIKEKLESLKDEESMIDPRKVEEALEENDLDRAEKALEELKEKYSEYKETIKKLESFDQRKSSLATQLADKEIDRDTYNDAVQNIEYKKAELEEKLNELRKEIIYEDYEKPF